MRSIISAFPILWLALAITPAAETNTLYNELWRPQFHFTAKSKWLNDPNGLVYYRGTYHLFFQHIPDQSIAGNQHWGHAVSPDLVHWTQLDHAIYPDKHGPIWSGSAVVDWNNRAGFQTGPEKAIVCIYTSAGGQSAVSKGEPFTQCLAYSTDGGRAFTKYAHNPVLQQVAPENRDPKVFWHEPTKRWVMVFYKTGNTFALYHSPDLKNWTPLHDVVMPGGAECPDMFEMPVEGKSRTKKWIITSASGNYVIGSFDGKKFTKESGPHRSDWGKNFYAVQTYGDIPKRDGRRIQIAWMAWAKYPGMPFDQQMSFPCELTLRDLPEGLRLCRMPVREIDVLRHPAHTWKNETLGPGTNVLSGLKGELFDIEAEIELGQATDVGFRIRGEPVNYSLMERKLSCLGQSVPLDPVAGRLKLRILVDRTSIEVYGNDGRVSLATCFLPDAKNQGLETYALNGPAKLVKLSVWELRAAWGR